MTTTTLLGRTAWETAQHNADHGMHARLAAGLREAADYIEAHPDLPIPLMAEVYYCIPAASDSDGDAEAARIAGMLGTPVTGGGISSEAHRSFGPAVSYRAVYVTRDSMAEWRALTSYGGNVKPAEINTHPGPDFAPKGEAA